MYISALEDRPIFVLDALLDVLLDALLSPPRSACTTKIMDEWPRTTCGQIQNRHSDGQVETPWSSASGIQIEHAANSLHPGPMRVAANDDVDPARDWIDLKCFDVVQDVDAAPAERYRLGLRIMLRPLAGIDVPSDRNDRRNPVESRDNVWRTDIAGVDDIRYACEELLNLRTQETVCVRDDSNSESLNPSLPDAVRRNWQIELEFDAAVGVTEDPPRFISWRNVWYFRPVATCCARPVPL